MNNSLSVPDKTEVLTQWKRARAEGQTQKDFCIAHDICARTLRTWIAQEGRPRLSPGKVEALLRRMGRHLLAAAEEIASGTDEATEPSAAAAVVSSDDTPPRVLTPVEAFIRKPFVDEPPKEKVKRGLLDGLWEDENESAGS